MFIIKKHNNVYYLWLAVLQHNDDGLEWEPKATINLPLNYYAYRFMRVAGGYLLLEGLPFERFMILFSVDLRTLQVERLCP